MKLEITKGEWNYCLNWDDKTIEIGTNEKENIALVNKEYSESLANAKLISSAPKMLEMLNNIYAWAEQEQSKIGEPPFLYEIDELLEKLKP